MFFFFSFWYPLGKHLTFLVFSHVEGHVDIASDQSHSKSLPRTSQSRRENEKRK